MTIKERLAMIEMEIKYIKKMLYALFIAIAGSTGIQII